MSSTSVYEAWVLGLRAWGADPTTDLSGLPTLTAESFTPATYQRLVKHLNEAIAAMMAVWNSALERAVTGANDEHEIARELVQLRVLLARRLQLARHPGFPKEISNSLWDGACADILSIQASLEREATKNGAGATTSRTSQERMLSLMRNNSFAAITDPGYPLEQLFGTGPSQTAEESNVASSESNDFVPRRRRVAID
jgi:hypothetical protein